jgi:hypothetical protein
MNNRPKPSNMREPNLNDACRLFRIKTLPYDVAECQAILDELTYVTTSIEIQFPQYLRLDWYLIEKNKAFSRLNGGIASIQRGY